MRDRLIELLNSPTQAWCYLLCKSNIEALADYLLANGVIVPPVSVGQKVYVYNGFVDKVVEGVVHILSYFERNRYITVCDDGSGTTPRFQEIYDVSEIGKTVFLTREEAEQKLKEVKG